MARFTQPKAQGGLCWHCDRKLYAGTRAYILVMVNGTPRPVHRACSGGYERADVDAANSEEEKIGLPPLRRVVERYVPGPCDFNQRRIFEEYECGHVEYWAPLRPAKRRRCRQCRREKWADVGVGTSKD